MKAAASSLLSLGLAASSLGCPTTDPTGKYSDACIRAVSPPPPFCGKFSTAADLVAHAEDVATRCCVEDMSACSCPVKNVPFSRFHEKMEPYCAAVKEGGACKPAESNEEAAASNNLRGKFDMEQQIQREEYAP
ncbi:hypothetical protein ACHAWF_009385 [Thalassiosira exigua]